MKIISLVENTSGRCDVSAEHGLSLYIELAECKILFDMGQTEVFVKNAEVLGIELRDIDLAVLSHGHYDHGGGLSAFLEINKKAPVYLSRYAFEEHYNGKEKYIGLDKSLQGSARLKYVNDKMDLAQGITIHTAKEVKRIRDLGAFGLTVMENGVLTKEDFRHEIYLEIIENERKILFSGCSHRGIMDIMDAFKPHTLIGGFHFSKIEDTALLCEYAEYLSSFETDYYTCHCTGTAQFECMKKQMPRLEYLRAGESIVF